MNEPGIENISVEGAERPVIYLDIEGVIVTGGSILLSHLHYNPHETEAFVAALDPVAVGLVKRLVKKVNGVVAVHSTLRADEGVMRTIKEKLDCELHPNPVGRFDRLLRCHEHIRQNGVQHYIIIDDVRMEGDAKTVWTPHGFTYESYLEAIDKIAEQLGREVPKELIFL